MTSSCAPARSTAPGGREIEVTEPSPRRIARILDNLAKRSNTELQDKALRILYVAAGFLDWHDAQRDKAISSPLVLVPVELRRESARDPYRLYFVHDEEIVINPSLTEKLRRDAGLEVPGDWVWEDKPIAQELDEIRQAVAGKGWSVREEAAIGLFSFQKYVMYRDLLDHHDRVADHPIVQSLAQGQLVARLRRADPEMPEPNLLDEVQEPRETLSILDADASQRLCIEAAKRGRSFVMQGPPGTGKSQTIANVIAEAIGQGRRILFVSEKAAALDVVHKRLAASGLDEYCLMLHGEHAGRREVVQALDRSLTSALTPRPDMRNEEMERLTNLRTVLNDSAEFLHLPQPLLGGRSLREVHEQLAQLYAAASVPGAPAPSDCAGEAVLDESQVMTEIFQRLAERWQVSPRDYLWRGYEGERFTADDHGRVVAILRELVAATTDVRQTGSEVAAPTGLARPPTLREAQRLADLGDHLEQAPPLEPGWLDSPPEQLRGAISAARAAYTRVAELAEAYAEAFPARRAEEFPRDIANRVPTARDEVRRACGWSPAWEKDLGALRPALGALEELPGLLDALEARAAAACELLGQPVASLSEQRLEGLAELAELAFTAEHRPERTWLVRAGLTRGQQMLDQVAGDVATYQRLRADLFEHYRPEALDLDAGAIGERFKTRYTSVFSKLSGAYRQDAKAIKATRADGKLPEEITTDLKLIADLRSLADRIGAQDQQLARALGSYAAGPDTDAAATREALVVAERALELSRADADLGRLADALALGSQPDPGAAQVADRLRDAVVSVLGRLDIVQRFFAARAELFAGDLGEFREGLKRITPPVQALAAQIADLDLGAAAAASTFADVERRANVIGELLDARAQVASDAAGWQRAIGAPFAGADTGWEPLQHTAGWLERLSALAPKDVPDPVRATLLDSDRRWPAFAEVGVACDRMRAAAQRLTQLFEPTRASELEEVSEGSSLDAFLEHCARLRASVDELRDWTEFRAWRERGSRQGWDGFVEGLIDAGVEADDVLPAAQRAYWNRRLEALYDSEPELAEDLRGGAFQRWVDEFRALDRKLVRSGADRLIARRERLRTTHVSTPGSEIDLLRREARKMRRHLPVRVLLSRIPTVLSELKPCLMMSPLTVSHFLSADHTFDLVVFDEASQVPPQDSINCIYRGRQLVVAGDSRQLPPTPFFQIAELDELAPDEEDASTQEDMESVLDACEALLPSHALRWHYRSRCEPLIAFSNRHIYDGSLVTFPSVEERSATRGVSFVHVTDGVYDRGRSASNRREAQVVAQRVMHRLLDGSGRSVGVIAFNTAQATAIGEELDLLRVQHPELEAHFLGDRLDAVFVKHLEAVQGDERDVIIFSVGYGPDANGKFLMNFGPLNKDGGQRRLNVAVTRAREQVELVASVRARDFNLSEGASAGARLLRDYIAYAEVDGRFDATEELEEIDEEWPSALEEEVGRAITDLGYEAVPNVGVGSFRIDIGVRDTDERNRFLLGIECDGEGYAETPTARDRERLRHEVLDELGWGAIHRIWSLDWVRNRSGELDRLRAALAAALARPRAPQPSPAPAIEELQEVPPAADAPRERVERVVHDLDSAAAAAALPWTEFYTRARLGSARSHYEFHESANRRQQTDMLVELVSVEAPINIDLAIRRLAEAWGLGRAGHRVISAGRQSVSQASRRGDLQIRGEFLWRPDHTLTRVRIPDPADPLTRRDVDEIAPEEIDLAIARLSEASAGLDDDQVIVQVARVLGFDRTGERIRSVLEERITAMNHGRAQQP